MNVRDSYLCTYNVVQLTLWITTLLNVLLSLLNAHKALSPFISASPTAHRAQTLAWLEVLHAALNLGGHPTTAFIQCLGRYTLLVHVAEKIPSIQTHPIATLLLLVWSLGDIIRYAFYLLVLYGRPSRIVTWLRYTAFFVLYPAGIAAEWGIYYLTLPHVQRVGLYRVRLPNAWNFAFDFAVWNRGVLLCYCYFAPYMMGHMMRLRRKKIGRGER